MKYRNKVNYRKIYKEHHGSIPKDENGKSYHIHHVDGDPNNNNISNLIAVSEKEHYEIHYRQGDLVACSRLATNLNLSKSEISNLLKVANETGQCGFIMGHASNAGKLGGKKFAENVKKSGKKYFNLTSGQEQKRLYLLQVGNAIKAGMACAYPKQSLDEVIYTFVNYKTNKKITATHFDFCFHFDLNYYQVGRMIKNKKQSYYNWTLEGRKLITLSEKLKGKLVGSNHPAYDCTVYFFQHKDGRKVSSTQYDMRIKYDLSQANLNAIIRGKRKSVSGWTLII